MFYLVYKITNIINNKYYIGVHQTLDKHDGYMGSGLAINRAYKKYGIENFKKEILFECATPEEMFAIEKEIVKPQRLDIQSYNLMEGGKGGFIEINSTGKNGTLLGVQTRLSLLKDNEWYKFWKERQKTACIEHSKTISKEEYSRRGKQANNTSKVKNGLYSFEGKSHTDETKRKIGEKNSANQKGERNSRYGTMWITDGTNNKTILKTDTIPEGWYRGRKIKNHNARLVH